MCCVQMQIKLLMLFRNLFMCRDFAASWAEWLLSFGTTSESSPFQPLVSISERVQILCLEALEKFWVVVVV